MSNDLNEIILTGRLGQDSQVYEKITRLSIAVSKNSKKDADGTWTSETDWINCLMFGQVNLPKGTRLKIWGSLSNNNWEKDGVKHKDQQVIVQAHKVFQDKKKQQQNEYEPDTAMPGEPE